MRLDRRGLLAMLPALLLAARAAAQGAPAGAPDQSAFQTELAPFWDQLAMLPYVRQPALGRPTAGICYMFTNKDCAVCQLVHKEYPKGYRRLEMRYVIYPWPGEPFEELNHMYRPGTTLAEFEAYMAHKLTARSPSASSAQGDLVMAVAAEMAQKLVEGGSFGTPFFFNGAPGAQPGKLIFSAGDIVAMAPFLDAAA
jgi:hypothetical protein